MKKIKSKAKDPIEVGQVVHVSAYGWLSKSKYLREYKITRFNKTSFYAIPVNNPDHYEQRFNRRDWSGKNTFDHLQAYADPDQYWNRVKLIEHRKKLIQDIEKTLPNLSLATLQKIDSLISPTGKENV